ncbi:hypothetical protein VOLCADRAFT_92574 [Volvox carteri f. nagariensis]|uniref:Ubiquitin-like protease family profile domain-containing protein n=1 Tax=Volvox carteri f. nagariensis TaxID=3068 RepID=D8U006_VOLCA|nr:uncharacterized protein VOLCADRAFT_92574 [Volvox carteri f. nagariensis]EFJ47098.1 hypothetical protein VOLCADRAFT_92574 [Volvox carteri f. nagariensis]|eukprot:XP_002951993.1 hypothetical protein VOLCADRAFT_92574 [Volvox carteri f. nagariensis]
MVCRHILENLPPEVRSRYHTFNTFFYDKLKQEADVTNWTKEVDIFSKDFIFIPVHSDMPCRHWSLAIICHPGNVVHPVADRNSAGEPQHNGGGRALILHLDSSAAVTSWWVQIAYAGSGYIVHAVLETHTVMQWRFRYCDQPR